MPAPAAPAVETPKTTLVPQTAPATVVVTVPADAKLIVDGHATSLSDEVRTFTTPELKVGEEYVYTFEATVERDGQILIATEEVAVRAGEATKVTLSPKATAQVAAK
jgi:uncharacterized protein (TIGR03000 family)